MEISQTINFDLKTKPFDKQTSRTKQIHPDLLQVPFTLLLNGPKGSGKSNVICRLLMGNKRRNKNCNHCFHKFYRHYFDKVYVFSPTWNLDDKFKRCKLPDDQVFDEPSMYEDIITEIVEGQAEFIEEESKEEADEILMIFTDVAGTKLFSNHKSIINKLAFNSRHYRISLILDSQSLRQINNSFRNNLSGLILFGGISNRLEWEKIKEEYLSQFNKAQIEQLMDYVFRDNPYNFLFINFQKRGKFAKFSKNFNPLEISFTEKAMEIT